MKLHYKQDDIINFTYNRNGLTIELREEATSEVKPKLQEKDMNERAKAFYLKVAEHVGEYDKDMLRAFYNYWTEHNVDGKKMRFEMQKVFHIGRRLATWASNNQNKKGFVV
jgi:hypothetical protein